MRSGVDPLLHGHLTGGTIAMKNPLDSLGKTIGLGLVLTVVIVLLIHAISGA